jgi:gamma-glutamylputrescine oxidase
MGARRRTGLLGAGAAALGALAVPLFAADRLPGRYRQPGAEPERAPSYWMTTIPPLPPCPTLTGDRRADIAVIGGGFTGLATAYYLKLAEPSLRVMVLEAQRMGSGASSRNSGGVGARFRGQAHSSGADRGYDLLKAFAEREGADFELVEAVPSLTLFTGTRLPADPVLAGADLHRAIGSSWYSAATLRMTNTLHPGKLIAALVAASQRLGVELYEWTPVQRIERAQRPVLHAPRATVTARDVVVATNAYTPQLGLARNVMTVMHHRVLVTRPLTPDEWAFSGLETWPLHFEDGGYYTHTVRATSDRRFFFRHVLGHRAFERTDWELGPAERALGHRELVRRYPWLSGVPVEQEWHGVTARTRDWWPLSGQLDEHLYIAVGYNGSGVMPAHFFGHLLASAILGLPDDDLTLLRPPREHSALPGELARHIAFQGWLRWRRWRDGVPLKGERDGLDEQGGTAVAGAVEQLEGMVDDELVGTGGVATEEA